MTTDFEEKWKQGQKEDWSQNQTEVERFFYRFDVNITDTYSRLLGVDYDHMQVVCYLISKIMLAVKLCDYLDLLKRDEHRDVDVIKIYLLISHAEITMNNLGFLGVKKDMVKDYFNPVHDEHRLKYMIKLSLTSMEEGGSLDFAGILYKIRNQYTHKGDYTGRIFKDKSGDAINMFDFSDGSKNIYGECDLTYMEFMNIYLKALRAHIDSFIKPKSQKIPPNN